jgi:DNA/RNA-binding domain of Phe-tRNA-synthetase-like protein
MLQVSPAWKAAYPGAVVGMLVMRGVANPEHHAQLEERKAGLEAALRARFAGADRAALNALPALQAYAAYFGRFKKTYPVQLQLESVALKGKSLPGVAALVEAMFMAELKNLLLTAGHDLGAVRSRLRLDVSRGDERYIRINGQEQGLKPNDMIMADAEGVIASVIYGPDSRTRIVPATRQALFVTYAPPGIGPAEVQQHLDDVASNVRLFAPEAEAEPPQIIVAE